MFEFGFSELVVIFVVALIVLGPTRLPGLVRKVGRWVGKARAMARDFRDQLESEVNLEELNRVTRQQSTSSPNAAPFEPAQPAEAGSTATTDATSAHLAEDPGIAASGYPYGVPTDAAVASESPPQPGDDTYSHAHGAGQTEPSWSATSADPAVTDTATAAEQTPAEETTAPTDGKQPA